MSDADFAEALEAAREIVAECGDETRLRAKVGLVNLSGYDEDGIREQYRAFIVAKALLASSKSTEA